MLPRSFFVREDVLAIARDLIGKVIVTRVHGKTVAARIVETEAYRGHDDRACHAYNNRRTRRTETMFHEGGCAYIYLCYGIHHLFNVVTAPSNDAQAVLIRGVEPLDGIETMLERRKLRSLDSDLSAGPGRLTKALGITCAMNQVDLVSKESPIWLEDRSFDYSTSEIVKGKRIGVDYAGECAQREWRFWVDGSPWVSLKAV